MNNKLPEDPKLVMLAGDWHANQFWAEQAVEYAVSAGAEVILHLGDFGYGFLGKGNDEYLDGLSSTLDSYDLNLFWIDGNHENHVLLQSLPIDQQTGLRPITERITHLPRGYRWSWHGLTWLALGGAHSIDKFMRREGVSWWPGEALTLDDVDTAISGGQADVMICHDAPDRVIVPGISATDSSWPPDELAASELNRALLGQAIDAVEPDALFHGHMHVLYRATRVSPNGHHTKVRGLAGDLSSASANLLVLDPSSIETITR